MSDFSVEPESPGPARVSNSLRNSREIPRDGLGLGGYPTVRTRLPIRRPKTPSFARLFTKTLTFLPPAPRPAQSESTEFDTVLETGESEPATTDREYLDTETEPETEVELPSPPRSPVRRSVEFASDVPMPSVSSPLRPKSRDATPTHSPILRSMQADDGDVFEDGPFSPQQAAAAVAAAAAAAASEVARRSIEGFGEVRATSELIPPNTPIPAMPGLDDSDASDGDMSAEPSAPIPKPEVGETETHFLNKNELNQPDVMSSIAGLPVSAVKPSKDAQFEQALERVRASRREIAEQAAKGFEDMKAYYEKELQQERSRSASVSASMERLPHRAAPHHTSMAPPPPRDPAAGRHEPGAVPAYLQRRKAEWAAEADAEAERRAVEAQCPPGLRLVGAEEKAGILGTLMGEKEKAEAALLQLPFVIKTNATQKKKDQLEARLLEIDGAVAAYSKEKVLVPIDA